MRVARRGARRLLSLLAAAALAGARTPNVLHLIADDMRPQLGAYGQAQMRTPNLDALAASGLVFETAYTQFAYCAPSRNSFMTGRRPERTRCLNFLTDFRRQPGDTWVALPQFFKNAGYFTSAAGKVFHDGMDDPLSWSFPSNQTQWLAGNGIPPIPGDLCDVYFNYCAVTAASEIPYTDEDLVLAEGLARMRTAHASGKPWLVGIGTHRPHWRSRLPRGFTGPDLYPNGVLAPKHPKGVVDAPDLSGAWQDGDFTDPDLGCPDCSAAPDRAVEYRRWYAAAVTYADHMLGQALSLLDELGERNNTIVVFHSDHGYQLGELNEWSKKTNNELAVRVPLIIRAPWLNASVGQRSGVRAELVDLYKTIVELAGLNASAIQADVQGVSLAPLFAAPAAPPPPLATKAAFSQIGSCACRVYEIATPAMNWTGPECDANRCAGTNATAFDFMGYSMITPEGWRFTAWVAMDNATARVDWFKPTFHELYDLTADPHNDFDLDAYAVNVAAAFPDRVAAFLAEMKAAVLSWY